MNQPTNPDQAIASAPAPTGRPLWRSLLKVARPTQWSKSAFVVVGPAYGAAHVIGEGRSAADLAWVVFAAASAFALASSGCYVVNDICDRVADRAHPRKRHRPIACGDLSPRAAKVFAAVLFALAALLTLAVPGEARGWVALCLGLYVLNVVAYSVYLKHRVIADVISLSLGFVLRVMGGCAAAMIVPSVWLLNVTFFLSMFLAFGKRLGERRTLSGGGEPGAESRAAEHRSVQAKYTDALLQMAVVVTAVITLMTYALYVQSSGDKYVQGFNLLWLTVLPATYALLRCIVLLEKGVYDDPTELAVHDRGFQLAGLVFIAITLAVMGWGIGREP